MIQNKKDLLLKDLCARLPYGVKLYHIPTNDISILDIIGKGFIDGNIHDVIDNFKPYLFPLSSMTEEQIFEINEILGGDFEIDKYGIIDLIRNRRTSLSYLELNALFEYFNKNHFDYRGLIEEGLAIDAIGKDIY